MIHVMHISPKQVRRLYGGRRSEGPGEQHHGPATPLHQPVDAGHDVLRGLLLVVAGGAVRKLQDLGGTTCLTLPVLTRPQVFFYGITRLIRLVEFAALFIAFEQSLCSTSSVRQAVPPEGRRCRSAAAWRPAC